MLAIRVLFLLVAVTAAFAGTMPAGHYRRLALASHNDLAVDAPTHLLQTQLSSQITDLETNSLTNDIISNATRKLKELVNKIKHKVVEVERRLTGALHSISEKVVIKINDFIKANLNIDLQLTQKLEDFEKKTQKCAASLKTQLTEILLDIKSKTETCAASQMSQAKAIGAQMLEVSDLLELVPARTFKNIRACSKNPTSSTGSWGSALNKTMCVGNELVHAFEDLRPMPGLVYQLNQEVHDLTSAESKQVLDACAKGSVASMSADLQTAAAQLTYCVIKPSEEGSGDNEPEPATGQ